MSVSEFACHPITLTRLIEDFPIGNIPLRTHHQLLRSGPCEDLSIAPHAWLDVTDATAFTDPGLQTLLAADGTPLAWRGDTPNLESSLTATKSFLIIHPWDLLRANEQFVGSLTSSLLSPGEVHPSAVLDGVVHLGAGARILPGVFIEGNVVIGPGCKVGPNCYIRGSTSIAADCHIGQAVEIKNSIILAKSAIGHLSYAGDSIIGEKVNFGAGTIISNFRHDGQNHRSMVDNVLVDTGRRKFGAIIGDGVHTGIHTSIYPGRKLWPGTSTRPGDIVQRDLH